jgi:molybdenum cofactor cytidylyltransferase
MPFHSKSDPKTKNPRPKTNAVAAILLAAGQSKRMGAFKPLLPFGEMTVIESCIDYLKRGGVETIVVVLGHQAETIREKLKNLPVRFALNPDPESEMSESIARGVRELPADSLATFIALTDYPAVPSAVVTALTATWKGGHAKLLAPEYEGRGGHPVLVDLCFRDQLLHLDSQQGLRGLFAAHRAEALRVPVNSPFVARDIDTWDDYRALYVEVFGAEPPNSTAG